MTSSTDGVIVTDWLRRVLHPRRGGIVTGIRPLAGVDDAWAGLRRGVWAQDAAIRANSTESSRVWQLVTSSAVEDRALGARLLGEAARIGDEGEDHALVRAVRERFQYVDHGADEWLADFLVAAHGLPEACRRVLGGFHADLPYTGVGVFGRLRELLVTADAATYAQARDVLLDVRDRMAKEITGSLRADLFWAVTYLLPLGPQAGPEERAAHAEAMSYVGRFGNAAVHASGLAAGDLDTLERFLHANDRVRHEFFAGRIYLSGVVETAGAAAGPVLARMRPDSPYRDDPHYNGIWCGLLAHVDDDTARAALDEQRRAGHTWATGFTVPETARVGVQDGSPCPYQPPKAVFPAWLDVAVPVEPVLRLRDAEREEAEQKGVNESAEQWDGVPIGRCDTAAVTAWLEHRERWAIPATLPALALAPRWTHERLMALGFTHYHYWVRSLVPLLLLRHGVSHVAPLLSAFGDAACAEAALEVAQPVGHASLAAPMARAFAGKKHRRLARSWLLRHPEHAAAGTVALWRTEPDDPATGRVLRCLDAQGHRALLTAQAADRAADLVTLLERDPLDAPKARKPKIPAYLTGTPLPPLTAADGSRATTDDQDHFLVRLASCDTDEVHPAVLAARNRWTAVSRAAFADALFDRWVAAGAPAADGWCMQAVGLIGDDAGARRLAAHARQWAGNNAAARAQAALDALRHRGTDAALIELSLLAERSRFPVFKSRAREHIESIADLRGLTPDELADRLVPSLGLDEEGGDVLDTGAGTFRVGFDHQLAPVLRDTGGRILADLPRGGDPQRRRAAKDRLTALRKEARASASLHVARLERAMCAQRRIPAPIFRDRFAAHPWTTHLARRLVWGVFDGETLTGTIRVAEDGTPATVDDDLAALPDDATLSVLHPLLLRDGEPAAWGAVFADYQLLQPFAQLDRPVHRDLRDLHRYAGRETTYAVLRGLERRGWTRWYDAAVQMAKPLGGGVHALLRTDPGWHASDTVDTAPPQTVVDVILVGAGGRGPGDLPPVVFSELVHDLRVFD
ncbi:DUF4132 domain-containing protein [Actinoplanes hulinensis]|uniref:DUF4132 domain-containing protein n=1 Tax=Actinoplanes hulinensis TaxID=1144547 RepID=A0ABS7B6V9_9ACTN|nr:DUF4132 domain-containing protein [Actinoplanes hulinensis]MBW6436642.1 DUF4132 domain-containing protein [Actinoplanes hulinensis]